MQFDLGAHALSALAESLEAIYRPFSLVTASGYCLGTGGRRLI